MDVKCVFVFLFYLFKVMYSLEIVRLNCLNCLDYSEFFILLSVVIVTLFFYSRSNGNIIFESIFRILLGCYALDLLK